MEGSESGIFFEINYGEAIEGTVMEHPSNFILFLKSYCRGIEEEISYCKCHACCKLNKGK